MTCGCGYVCDCECDNIYGREYVNAPPRVNSSKCSPARLLTGSRRNVVPSPQTPRARIVDFCAAVFPPPLVAATVQATTFLAAILILRQSLEHIDIRSFLHWCMHRPPPSIQVVTIVVALSAHPGVRARLKCVGGCPKRQNTLSQADRCSPSWSLTRRLKKDKSGLGGFC